MVDYFVIFSKKRRVYHLLVQKTLYFHQHMNVNHFNGCLGSGPGQAKQPNLGDFSAENVLVSDMRGVEYRVHPTLLGLLYPNVQP